MVVIGDELGDHGVVSEHIAIFRGVGEQEEDRNGIVDMSALGVCVGIDRGGICRSHWWACYCGLGAKSYWQKRLLKKKDKLLNSKRWRQISYWRRREGHLPKILLFNCFIFFYALGNLIFLNVLDIGSNNFHTFEDSLKKLNDYLGVLKNIRTKLEFR